MNNPLPQIVHEAESQRQHARIELLAEAELDGKRYRVTDFSNGGIALEMPHASFRSEGDIHDAILYFEFDGFNMDLPIQLQIVSAQTKSDRVSFRFYEPDRRQQSILQYFVSAYMGGELVQVQDVLDVVSRNNMTKARNLPDPTEGMSPGELKRHKLKNTARVGALALFSIFLFGFVVSSIYERLYIVTAASAEVTAQMLTVDAPAGGKIHYKPLAPDTKVKKGQPVISVHTATGNILSVDSPCDCIVKRRLLDNNRIARKGEPALELVQPNATPYVQAYIPYKDATKLSVKQEVLIALPGKDEHLRGEIKTLQAGKGVGGNALVTIIPSEELPISYIDDPVEVRIDTAGIL